VMRTSDSSRARMRVPNLEKLRLGRLSLGAGGASSVRIFDPPANSGRRTAVGRVALASALSRHDRPTLCRRLRAGGWDIEQGSCLGPRRMASDFESDSRSAFLARWQPEPARLMRTNRSGPQKICKRVIGLRSEEVLGYEPDRAPPCHITWGWCGVDGRPPSGAATLLLYSPNNGPVSHARSRFGTSTTCSLAFVDSLIEELTLHSVAG
jgi:hypothetical protein